MDQHQWQSRAGNGRQAEPEILPPGELPGYDYQQSMPPIPPMPPPRRRRSGWQLAPATYVLTGINIAVFLLMVLNGVSPMAPTGNQLIHWGANVGLFVIADHQWWRLVTSTFVHSGIIHIATNMWCLYNLGLLGEPLIGAFGVVAAYLLTGVVGNLLSVALHPGAISGDRILDLGVVSVGASGAVFGLAGVLIPLLGSKLLPVDRTEVARLRRSVIYFAVLELRHRLWRGCLQHPDSHRQYGASGWISLPGCCSASCWCQSWDRTAGCGFGGSGSPSAAYSCWCCWARASSPASGALELIRWSLRLFQAPKSRPIVADCGCCELLYHRQNNSFRSLSFRLEE